MSTAPVVVDTRPNAGKIAATVINDIFAAGTIAAGIFVKNPAHQVEAGNFLSAIAQVLKLIEGQLSPAPTGTPAPVTSGQTPQ